MKTKQQLQEEIDKLRKELEELKSENRFEKVYHSEEKYVLLEDKDGDALVKTWILEEALNDFKYFEKENSGQFFISGDVQPVELLIDGNWKRFDTEIIGRFLKK